jgi:hypothetical protein
LPKGVDRQAEFLSPLREAVHDLGSLSGSGRVDERVGPHDAKYVIQIDECQEAMHELKLAHWLFLPVLDDVQLSLQISVQERDRIVEKGVRKIEPQHTTNVGLGDSTKFANLLKVLDEITRMTGAGRGQNVQCLGVEGKTFSRAYIAQIGRAFSRRKKL